MSSTPHSQEDTFAPTAPGRYYLDIYDGERLTLDEDGVRLDGPQTAKAEALGALAEKVRGASPDGDHLEFAVEVRDEIGHRLWRARLSLDVESLPLPDQ